MAVVRGRLEVVLGVGVAYRVHLNPKAYMNLLFWIKIPDFTCVLFSVLTSNTLSVTEP